MWPYFTRYTVPVPTLSAVILDGDLVPDGERYQILRLSVADVVGSLFLPEPDQPFERLIHPTVIMLSDRCHSVRGAEEGEPAEGCCEGGQQLTLRGEWWW